MSYDLYFKTRNAAEKPTIQEVSSYFRQRKYFEVSTQQAWYKNDTTGVYFVFDLNETDESTPPDQLSVSFNLNYCRPHIFGLEAEPEVRNFIATFDLLVSD